MKDNSRKIIYVTVILCVIGFLLTIADFLALHDVHNEYVSTGILKSLNISLSGDLPEWTDTKGEWGILRVSYIFRFIFFVFFFIVLYKLVNGLKNKIHD
jgi:hypothetical protein